MSIRVLIAGYCVACLVVAWLRAGRPGVGRPWPGVGWCAALLAVAASGAGLAGDAHWRFALLMLLAAGAVAVVAPGMAPGFLAASLVALGLYGFWVDRAMQSWFPLRWWPLYGVLPLGNAAWWDSLVLPEACAFLAAGLWLGVRTASRRSRFAARLAAGPAPWALLLLPLLGMTAALWSPPHMLTPHVWSDCAILAVAVLTLVVTAADWAADLMVVGMGLFGLYGIALGVFWQHLAVPDGSQQVPYGAVMVQSQLSAACAAVEGLLFLGFAAWLAPRTIMAHSQALLGPADYRDLVSRVRRLTESRAVAVDSAAAELRRIERDLHDGAQARLVALGMSLRAAERLIPTSPDSAVALVAEARETSARALADLRDLVRGIYPPVLADRGLDAAVRALALDAPLPTLVDIDLPGRLELPVESACYFAVAEALANAARHSSARRVRVDVRFASDRSAGQGTLRVGITDDGVGGADPANGTGLAGVERRLAAFDGVLAVSSPPGGPTVVAMEVPCALSSPRTSSS
ncbi:MAG TPA: histidine kinase [Streptosporangiaceae bacterium]|nr:histidine kinase [Streptosporangiaceae bacterium]